MNDGSDPNKPYYFLKGYNGNFQMHIYKLLTDLDFLLRSAQNCTKMHFSGKFKDQNSGKKHEN